MSRWVRAGGGGTRGAALTLFSVPQLPGKKDLFLEADLMSPLDRIANVSILKVGPRGVWEL